jgi:hypothetical protein
VSSSPSYSEEGRNIKAIGTLDAQAPVLLPASISILPCPLDGTHVDSDTAQFQHMEDEDIAQNTQSPSPQTPSSGFLSTPSGLADTSASISPSFAYLECSHCDRTFTQRWQLKYVAYPDFSCPNMLTRYNSKHNTCTHARRFECSVADCQQAPFGLKSGLERHMATVHCVEGHVPAVSCSVEGYLKTFSRRYNMLRQMLEPLRTTPSTHRIRHQWPDHRPARSQTIRHAGICVSSVTMHGASE